jgi:hypothetical protein
MPATVGSPGGSGVGAVLDGVLERVTFANPETGYTIARIAPEGGGAELVTAAAGCDGGKPGRTKGAAPAAPSLRRAGHGRPGFSAIYPA